MPHIELAGTKSDKFGTDLENHSRNRTDQQLRLQRPHQNIARTEQEQQVDIGTPEDDLFILSATKGVVERKIVEEVVIIREWVPI